MDKKVVIWSESSGLECKRLRITWIRATNFRRSKLRNFLLLTTLYPPSLPSFSPSEPPYNKNHRLEPPSMHHIPTMLITLAFLSRVSPLARPFPFYHRSTASRLFSTVPDASTSPHNTNSNFHDTILPPSNSNNNNNNSNNNSRPGASAGAGVYHSKLHNFPVPPSMDMILSRSYKASLKAIVPSTSSLPNAKLRTIKSTSIRLSVYGSTAGVLIRDCIAGYRSVLGDSELSDFERVCIDLTMQAKVDRDGTDLRELIKELDERRKGFVRLTKDLAAESKTFQSAKGANQHKVSKLIYSLFPIPCSRHPPITHHPPLFLFQFLFTHPTFHISHFNILDRLPQTSRNLPRH